MDIKLIQQLPDKTVIDSFTGTITKVWDYKKDVGEHKSTQQNIVVNSAGVGVTMTLWNQPEVSKEKIGKTITADCAHGQNAKPTGLAKTSYKDQLQISVSGKCLVRIGQELLEEPSDTGGVDRYAHLRDPAPSQATQAPPQTQRPLVDASRPQETASGGNGQNAVMEAKKAAVRSGALYQIAIDRVKRLVDWAEQRGFKVTTEAACSWVTSIKIDLEKQGLGSSMPVDKPVHDYVSSIGDWGRGADRADMKKSYDPHNMPEPEQDATVPF
jgi:hypothetical protein